MADFLVSKFIDPKKNIKDQVAEVEGLPVQLGYYSPGPFFDLDHDMVFEICKDHDVDVKSVHAPTVDVFDGPSKYFGMLETIRDAYEVYNVTIHPGRGNPLDAFKFFDKHSQDVEDLQMALMYENFDDTAPNMRWLPRAKNILTVDIDCVFLTYDTSHVKMGRNIVWDLMGAGNWLGMVHLSDRTHQEKHLPVGEGDQRLDEALEEYLWDMPVWTCLEYNTSIERVRADYERFTSNPKNRPW